MKTFMSVLVLVIMVGLFGSCKKDSTTSNSKQDELAGYQKSMEQSYALANQYNNELIAMLNSGNKNNGTFQSIDILFHQQDNMFTQSCTQFCNTSMQTMSGMMNGGMQHGGMHGGTNGGMMGSMCTQTPGGGTMTCNMDSTLMVNMMNTNHTTMSNQAWQTYMNMVNLCKTHNMIHHP